MLVALLRERGYAFTKRESESDLRDKVVSLESKIEELRNREPSSPEEREQRFAESLRDHMNRSITPWDNLGEPPDAA